jgi:hypothetical protein
MKEKQKHNFKLTMHCRARYCERIVMLRKTKIEKYLSQEINVKALDARIHGDLRSAQETTKPFQIQSIHDFIVKKYGQQTKFYHSEKVIYVIQCEEGINHVMTCYDKKGYIGYFVK